MSPLTDVGNGAVTVTRTPSHLAVKMSGFLMQSETGETGPIRRADVLGSILVLHASNAGVFGTRMIRCQVIRPGCSVLFGSVGPSYSSRMCLKRVVHRTTTLSEAELNVCIDHLKKVGIVSDDATVSCHEIRETRYKISAWE